MIQTRLGDVNSGLHSIIQEMLDGKYVMWLQLDITTANYTSHLHINSLQCSQQQQLQQQWVQLQHVYDNPWNISMHHISA